MIDTFKMPRAQIVVFVSTSFFKKKNYGSWDPDMEDPGNKPGPFRLDSLSIYIHLFAVFM